MVLKKIHKNHLLTPISILSLVILLLFSPCNVRNGVQSALNIPITEVSNKSKTILKSSQCNHIESISIQNIISKIKKDWLPIYKLDTPNYSLQAKASLQKISYAIEKLNYTINGIPYYILYKNFKVYLK